jgi:hypothetical protein
MERAVNIFLCACVCNREQIGVLFEHVRPARSSSRTQVLTRLDRLTKLLFHCLCFSWQRLCRFNAAAS